ncbi:carboxypeptidase B-like [Toxorhynchites rutilus septentrionalis]|uniref:carboxypeptidase B-like n=1 Tax=Toxorhynchites rutilus septentrionalis TaxID=329112 RepID=UPI00247A087D|nr:carboxypeptidase B-like [Toxorhynchites rutilus septentrionalis]
MEKMKPVNLFSIILTITVLVINLSDPVFGLSTAQRRSSDVLIVEGEGSSETVLEETVNQESEPKVIKYDGAQLWRIEYDDQLKKNAVGELQDKFEAAMWNYNTTSVDIFLKRSKLVEARNLLQDAKVPFDVVIDDMQKAIDQENPPKDQLELWENRDGYRMTWTAYHRLADIYEFMDYLAVTYPDLCSVRTIGKSVEGRDLKVLRISNGNPSNKAIWIDGGIHAREWISPAVVTYIVHFLLEEWDDQPEYVHGVDFYILPVHNPDGYEYSHMYDRLWRKNRRRSSIIQCVGVDLNRNYGHKWGGQGASRQPCSEIFAGKGPFSEPETKAVENFMKTTAAPFKAYVTFHSYGQYILYPWGYNQEVPEDHKDLQAIGQQAAQTIQQSSGSSYTVGPSGKTLYPASGGSDDWARGTHNIKYAYTVELRDTGRHGFVLPANQILPTASEAVAFVSVIANAISNLN